MQPSLACFLVLLDMSIRSAVATRPAHVLPRTPTPMAIAFPAPANAKPPATCKVLEGMAVNKTYVAAAAKAGSTPDKQDDETKELQALMAANPKMTLWDLFIQRTHEIGHKLDQKKNKAEAVIEEGAKITGDTVEHVITYAAAAAAFMAKVFYQPKDWWHKVKHWFKEFGQGTAEVGHMLWHEPLEYSMKQIGGGIMINVVDHPAEFAAETGLLVVGGFAVIHGFMHGMEAILGTLPAAVSTTLLSVLVFVHCLDEPILILAPILQMTVDTVASAKGDASHVNITATLNLPAGTALSAPLPRLATCRLPAASPAYQLHYGDFCDASEQKLRHIVFGLDRDVRKNLTREDTAEAWNRYQDFVCCYGPSQFALDDIKDKVPQARDIPVAPKGCTELLGHYPPPAQGHARAQRRELAWLA